MKITIYNGDSGNRDLSTEKKFNSNTSFFEVLKKAIELKAFLIVKTSYINSNKPGSWYLKGFNKNYNYDEIKLKIEENVKKDKYKKRVCYLIKY